MVNCLTFIRARKQAQKHFNSSNHFKQSNRTSNSSRPSQEFAGNASLPSSDPSDPLTPLQLDADIHWTADTGATSHITPHRHWLHHYKPLSVPICLANNHIVYSAGVGSVVFSPVINGKVMRSVEFIRVLHVPALRNNLLSVLFLARQHHLSIHIERDSIKFLQHNQLLFCAPINDHNTAFLDGTIIPPSLEASAFSRLSTIIPLDYSLWHRRFAHHHLAGVQSLVQKQLVTGLKLDSKATPDPICEPCLSGKLVSPSFPSSSHRASQPLQLIHSDVHGPMSVQTHSEFRYWVFFIDDFSRFHVVVPLLLWDLG